MAKKARRDLRFKDAESAPPIVSEKRITIFLLESVFREMRVQAGFLRVANATADADDPLPESPSAVAREAVAYWLDQFAAFEDRTRTPAEWEAFIARAKKAMR